MSEKKLTKSSSRELSAKQKEIVESPERLIFVSSGPGTGKTRVLIERIMYLVKNCGIRPEEILILTFTKWSTKEIQSRLGDDFKVRTFDSYCWSKFRDKDKKIKHAPNEWPDGWLHDYRQEWKFDYSTKKFVSILSNEWSEIKDFLDDNSNSSKFYFFSTSAKLKRSYEELSKLISSFEKKLKESNYVTYPQIRRKIIQDWPINDDEENYKAIIVDEVQDVDTQDLKIIELISESKNVENVFLIGDLNQSIYSFRGSDSKKLIDWIEDKGFKKFYLNQNYRSTKNIVNVCNSLIEDESAKIFTDNEEGDKVLFKGFTSTQLEAEWIVNRIKQHQESGISLEEIVILVRSTSDKFSDLNDLLYLLQKEGIYYNLNNKEEQRYKVEAIDIIKKYVDLVRYSNVPYRCVKILKEFLEFKPFKKWTIGILKFEEFIEKEKLNFMDALNKFCLPLSSSPSFLQNILKSLTEIKKIKEKKLSKIVSLIYEKNIKWLYTSRKKKLYHYHLKVLSFIGELDNHYSEYYLDDFDKIYSEIVIEGKKWSNGLTISTIHQAKGLEWDCVFVRCGRIKEIDTDPTDDEATIFVAFSRAKKFLYATCPKQGKFSFESYEFIDKKKLEKYAVFEDWE